MQTELERQTMAENRPRLPRPREHAKRLGAHQALRFSNNSALSTPVMTIAARHAEVNEHNQQRIRSQAINNLPLGQLPGE